MKSTGEVMGFDKDFGMAFAKDQIAAANSLPKEGLAFISLKESVIKKKELIYHKQLDQIKLYILMCNSRDSRIYPGNTG